MLIQELQKKCFDKTTSIAELLRFALIVARKLKLPDFATWITDELNGYDAAQVPRYRIIQCELMGFTGCKWIPIVFNNLKIAEDFSEIPIWQSIKELENLCESSQAPILTVPLPISTEKQIRANLNKYSLPPDEIKLHISSTRVIGIIDKVKTHIVTWSSDLEEAGIIGKEMSFSKEEQIKAQNHITMNFFDKSNIVSAENGMVQISTHGSSQSSTQNSCDREIIAKLLELINQMQQKCESVDLTPNQNLELKKIFESLHAEMRSSSPKKEILKQGFDSLIKFSEKYGLKLLELTLQGINLWEKLSG